MQRGGAESTGIVMSIKSLSAELTLLKVNSDSYIQTPAYVILTRLFFVFKADFT